MHERQLSIGTETVHRLIADQFPRWAPFPVTAVLDGGTVNAVFRVGDTLGARFPLVLQDPHVVEAALQKEARRARLLLGSTRFASPEPVAFGRPGPGYPQPWAIHTWVPGETAASADPSTSLPFADDLAELVLGIRALDTHGGAHDGRGRGGPDLSVHDAWMAECMDRSEHLMDVATLRRLWSQMRTLPRGQAPDVMNHGDLVPGNLLTHGGRLTGVLDPSTLGPADPSLDLVGAWHLLDDGPRAAFRVRLAVDDLTWSRGRAWAFVQAMGVVWYYRDSHPPMSRMGQRTLERIVAHSER